MSDGLDVVPQEDDPKIGIEAADRAGIAEGLGEVLADTYKLLFKTHAYHWNVEGPLFYSLHNLTEEQYEDLFAAADDIAERMRALGKLAPFTMQSLHEHSLVKDATGTPSAREMVEDLVRDHEAVSKRFTKLSELSDDKHDPTTADLCNGRGAFHDKAAWMLRAIAAQ